MLNQKQVVRRIYLDMLNDPSWLGRYLADPDGTLRPYQLDEANQRTLKRILKLFC